MKITKIRDKRGYFTTNFTETRQIIREYYTLCQKLNNVHKMNKFLEKYKLLKLTQQEIENLKRPTTSIEIVVVIRKLPTKTIPEPDAFTSIKCSKKNEHQFSNSFKEQKKSANFITHEANIMKTKVSQRYHKKTIGQYPL